MLLNCLFLQNPIDKSVLDILIDSSSYELKFVIPKWWI